MGEVQNHSGEGERDRKKVLIVARSFPPFRTVGGSIRVVKFIKYLPSSGWQPVVLTVDDRTEYESQQKQGSIVLLPEIPEGVKIYRIGAAELTAGVIARIAAVKKKRNLAGRLVYLLDGFRRRVLRLLLIPDSTLPWLPGAVWHGVRRVRADRIDAIFATCPAYSVSLIGACIRLLTGKPLILDFRDDWIDTPFFRSKPRYARVFERKLERWAVKNAERVLLVTERSRTAFTARYPQEPAEKFVFLPNGCDLEDYVVTRCPACQKKKGFEIVHAGLLLESASGPYRRSPSTFFQAVHDLKKWNPELEGNLFISFTGRLPDVTRQRVEALGLTGSFCELGDLLVEDLIDRFRQADLLLAINYDGWETIIPGKIYEYWAAGGPPILLISCPGAAKDLVERHGLGIVVDPNHPQAIARAIWHIYQRREAGAPLRVNPSGIEMYDRKFLARRLAEILDNLAPRGKIQAGVSERDLP
jgi:glycosyltransferase involved in cell wall biosynthesis